MSSLSTESDIMPPRVEYPTRTHPGVIRDALELADKEGRVAAARAAGVTYRTIERWQKRRARIPRPWPSDRDIEAWEADHAANAAARARKAAKAHEYRKRVYVNRGPVQVPILGTQRRIRALCALGWTFEEIGAEMGVTGARVGHLAAGVWKSVYPETAADVDRVFRKLCMTVPADPEPTRRGEVRVHDRCRKWARNKGWPPPLAWDDIDEPDEQPKRLRVLGRSRRDVDPVVVEAILDGRRVESTRAEKDEAMRRWALAGRGSRAALCRRHGWKEDRYWPVRFAVTPTGVAVDLHGVEDIAEAWPHPTRKDHAA